MPWDAAAKAAIEKAPKEIQAMAISGTEDFAREKGYKEVTEQVIKEFKKETGMG